MSQQNDLKPAKLTVIILSMTANHCTWQPTEGKAAKRQAEQLAAMYSSWA